MHSLSTLRDRVDQRPDVPVVCRGQRSGQETHLVRTLYWRHCHGAGSERLSDVRPADGGQHPALRLRVVPGRLDSSRRHVVSAVPCDAVCRSRPADVLELPGGLRAKCSADGLRYLPSRLGRRFWFRRMQAVPRQQRRFTGSVDVRGVPYVRW